MVGLTAKRDAEVKGLSRGMRQRLMLAKTLIPDPQVLILDEPASGVDPQGRIDLKNVLRAQAAAGKTVLISSHILAEMTEFCTSIAIMQKGQMVVSGRIEEIRDRILGAATMAVELVGPADGFVRMIEEDGHCGGADVVRRERSMNSRSPATPRRPASCWPGWCGAGCAWPPSRGGGRAWKNCSSPSGPRSCRDARELSQRAISR